MGSIAMKKNYVLWKIQDDELLPQSWEQMLKWPESLRLA